MALIDDEEIQLSPEAQEALRAFLSEKDERQSRFEALKKKAEDEDVERRKIVTISDFEEDWQHSQFWYDHTTAQQFAEELLDGATDETVIGIVSAPSVFVKIQEMKNAGKVSKGIQVHLLEFDDRFDLFDEFVHYDFKYPLRLPESLKGKFDRIILDPPFLSNDCQTKSALTVRWMMKPWTPSNRLIVCTGERMQGLVEKLYKHAGIRTTTYEVRHMKGLSNEFLCYSSFESKTFTWEHIDTKKRESDF
ncbi:uncharacterized protein H6S33_013083 [Morchella sextelata]|uniref:uncharacterized protein n=1 Tax=Morchella sextelata TaxID=1174677 RepID=UPI001D04A58C|nr:uncharacterized protein H6S33_013083 [Morchella sextelata]KAH0609597.1 hypothetical protein H6S33_013083 [Morchella sextelata]